MQKFLKKTDYNYELPEELIAQTPADVRDESRLFVVDRSTGTFTHRIFHDITEYFHPGDILVRNDSKVIPARLYAKRCQPDGMCLQTMSPQTGDRPAEIEVLLLERKEDRVWDTIVRPGKKCRKGTRLVFDQGLTGVVEQVSQDGNRLIRFEYEGDFYALLDRVGTMPLPPYIHNKNAPKDRYQTVYAKYEGSAAAPTAGLHFTEGLIDALKSKGVEIVDITLHVGLGTFRPVKEEEITKHKMHSEYYTVTPDAAERYNRARRAGGRVFAVGTTSCRTLESACDGDGYLQAKSAYTDIFIYPGYSFRAVDRLITNFHLPQSTLMMLVSALAGHDLIMKAYECAVREKYRFFSFGDAMLIL